VSLYDVAVLAPLSQALTYAYSGEDLPLGIRVLVPLGQGRRLVSGYVVSRQEKPPVSGVKNIVEVLDPFPLFPSELLPLFYWMAAYYHHPLGEVINTALPKDLQGHWREERVLTPLGRRLLPSLVATWPQPLEDWVTGLLHQKKITGQTLHSLAKKPLAQEFLQSWQEKGWLKDTSRIAPKVPRKQVTLISLAPHVQTLVLRHQEDPALLDSLLQGLKKSEQKTLRLFVQQSQGRNSLAQQELTAIYPGARLALKSLAAAGLIHLEQQQVYRDPFGQTLPFLAPPVQLTAEQSRVLDSLLAALEARVYQPFLLHGVTGSGKTEIYLRAAEYCLSQQRSVLILVPEIALASHLEHFFSSRFGERFALLHSGLSRGERGDQWLRVLRQEAQVVLGTRSAVFAPCTQLGLVIVDEEHEAAYKQDEGLRYNGRDMAILRARFAACPVLLGSATPSVNSFYQAEQGRYQLLTLSKRIHDQAMPRVEVVDLSKPGVYGENFFSQPLQTALQENIDQGFQSLLYVNRRGYASFMLCQACKSVMTCRHCRVSLTHHQGSQRWVCHYCGYSTPPLSLCPECGTGTVVGLGIGSERIEAEARRLFPQARIVRIDSDTSKNRRHYLALLQQLREEQVDILVGTQMVAKGLHFPRMTLVGVVWADSGLGMPDYKAGERSFQVLTQVMGRAGRAEHPGRVILQTHQPQHYAIVAAQAQVYQEMYAQEKVLREALGYPPFGRLINIRLSGTHEQQVMELAQQVRAFLQGLLHDKIRVEILGPAPAPVSMIKNRFRWQILLKGRQSEQLHWLCERLCAGLRVPKGLRMKIDVDPENMM
jgi:primosomal protein N' (replication factor Y)